MFEMSEVLLFCDGGEGGKDGEGGGRDGETGGGMKGESLAVKLGEEERRRELRVLTLLAVELDFN